MTLWPIATYGVREAIGITRLGAYFLCLSVIASVMPRSRNTALATISAPISLSIIATASLPSDVLQLIRNVSSDLRTDAVDGIGIVQMPRLFCRVHVPGELSLKESVTGTMGSFIRVAQPGNTNRAIIRVVLFMA